MLHSFGGPGGGTTPEGNLALDADGVLYSTTDHGGGLGKEGTLFSLTPTGTEDDFTDIEAERQARERSGMSEQQLMGLRTQIEATRQRGNAGENVRGRLLELRRSHFGAVGRTAVDRGT